MSNTNKTPSEGSGPVSGVAFWCVVARTDNGIFPFFKFARASKSLCFSAWEYELCGDRNIDEDLKRKIAEQELRINNHDIVELRAVSQTANIVSQYPRLMEVRRTSNRTWKKRVVIAERDDCFIAWSDAETIEDSEKSTTTSKWKEARELS